MCASVSKVKICPLLRFMSKILNKTIHSTDEPHTSFFTGMFCNYTHTHTHIYIYIYRERERERGICGVTFIIVGNRHEKTWTRLFVFSIAHWEKYNSNPFPSVYGRTAWFFKLWYDNQSRRKKKSVFKPV